MKEAVKTAIASGYRLLDCAYIYGNESEIGEALTEVFQKGSVRREDLFIISKVCDCVLSEILKLASRPKFWTQSRPQPLALALEPFGVGLKLLASASKFNNIYLWNLVLCP